MVQITGKTLAYSFDSINDWFTANNWTPFDFQREVWDAYHAGASGLIHAPTGTGKTYAAWFGPLIEWLAEADSVANPAYRLAPPLRVLWITPLRALSADTATALQKPVTDLKLPWTIELRTGDTSSATRNRQKSRLPSTLITTPESLTLFLSRPEAKDLFRDLRCVIVDEWHELLGSKRGVQTELALARLRRWRPALRTWGLSATIGNLDSALHTLIGAVDRGGRLVKGIIDKPIRIETLIPPVIERFPWAGHLGLNQLPQVIETVEAGQTALIFCNTRLQTEAWYQAILDARPDWAGVIALHHSSLERTTRNWVEDGLRTGALRCVVSTSSLDLGVDFAPVDQVIQIGSPKGIARLVQRAGRSGHAPGRESRIWCVPTNALELIEIAAARSALAAGQIESRLPLARPLDTLIQHLVTIACGGGFESADLLAEVRTTAAFKDLSEAEWAWALDFVTRGGAALAHYPEYARVVAHDSFYIVDDPAIARRHRLSIGTIVSDAALRVQYLKGKTIGTVEESFIARLRPGDQFILGGKVIEFVRVRDMTAWVRLGKGSASIVPRWAGGRLPLSTELADAVRDKLDRARRGELDSPEMQALIPVLNIQAAWSQLPAADGLLIERSHTRDGYHIFLYPFAGRMVHEGLGALFAYRMAQRTPITFSLSINDYGLALLSHEIAPLEDALAAGLFSTDRLSEDIAHSLNEAELARRQFREIARVAGLMFQGYPGSQKTARQLQASSGLLYDVFARYDPANLLLQQADREVLDQQLEFGRLTATLERLSAIYTAGRVTIIDVPHTTPFAFPLLVNQWREVASSEKLSERVRRMQITLERAADARPRRKRARS